MDQIVPLSANPSAVPGRGVSAQYVSLIDGLRGLAALAVLLFHYVHFYMSGPNRAQPAGSVLHFPAYPYLKLFYENGYLAVQIFWLISGFVFAYVYYGSASSTRSFAINRIARLYPLHFVTLLLVTALQFVALHRVGYTLLYGHFDLNHFVAQIFMASDWIRWDANYSFNGPIWSVSVEVVVYALFWLTRGLAERFGLPLLAALVLAFYFAQSNYGDYSNVLPCGFYFFFGCAVCHIHRSAWGSGVRAAVPLSLLAGAGGAGAIEATEWSWRILGLPGFCGALFLLLALFEGKAPRALKTACKWLGETTYGAYLWHVPLQLIVLLALMRAVDVRALAGNLWFLAAYLTVVIAVARLSFVYLERPARDWLRRALRARGRAGIVGAP